jgi:DNA (cytosine-5-)-methyltransferase|nr:MAG TPA: adenine-specific methyltransferase [Caudoviricetes sp.]
MNLLEFKAERGFHPTQKPVSLFEYLIKTYTNKGDTVLDCCMGSGTTAIACINTERHYIGFEIDQTFCEISLERIRKRKDYEL